MLAVLNRDPSPPATNAPTPRRRREARGGRGGVRGTASPPQKKVREGDFSNPVQASTVGKGNPQLVEPHLEEILCNLGMRDSEFESIADYLSRQRDLNGKMRGILVDWLVDVNLKFKLLPQTLFLTVSVLDRFLAVRQIERSKLQLIGVTALMIVAKYEEIYPPQLKDYVAVCDNAYTRSELLRTEAEILQALNFELNRCTPYTFLELFRQKIALEDKAFIFARYLLETALLDPIHLRHSALDLAAAALFLVHKVYKLTWGPAPVKGLREFDEAKVKVCAKDLFVLLNKYDASQLSAVKRKFSEAQYFEVSKYRIETGRAPAASSSSSA